MIEIGRERAMNLEQLIPLAESISKHWKVDSFDESLLVPAVIKLQHYKY